MLKMAEITPDDVLFDLGSGDGRIVIARILLNLHMIAAISALIILGFHG
jgi:hypothetical protein